MNLFAKIFKTIHCFLAIVRDLLTLCLILVILIAAALFLAAVSMMGESNGRSAENKPLPLSESHTIIITLNSGLADADDQESALEQFIRELGDGGDQPDSKDSYIIAEAIGRFCGDDNVKNVILSLDDFAGGSLGNIELIGKKLGELRSAIRRLSPRAHLSPSRPTISPPLPMKFFLIRQEASMSTASPSAASTGKPSSATSGLRPMSSGPDATSRR